MKEIMERGYLSEDDLAWYLYLVQLFLEAYNNQKEALEDLEEKNKQWN